MIILTSQTTAQIGQAIGAAFGAGFIGFIILLAIGTGIFCLQVALATYIVKRVWFSDWGGNPRRYR